MYDGVKSGPICTKLYIVQVGLHAGPFIVAVAMLFYYLAWQVIDNFLTHLFGFLNRETCFLKVL